MDFQKLKTSIKEISAIASDVPEPFRERCFEILLQGLLAEEKDSQEGRVTPEPPTGSRPPTARETKNLPIPTTVRVFMAKTGVTESDLNSILFYADDEVHFIKEPKKSSNAQAQMDWALLLALRHAITSNEFLTDPEDVRSVCKEKDCYDAGNFARIFKFAAYEKWFKKPLEPQREPQLLADDGQTALGDLVKTLAGTAQ